MSNVFLSFKIHLWPIPQIALRRIWFLLEHQYLRNMDSYGFLDITCIFPFPKVFEEMKNRRS